jgi:hypothetical protein
MTAALRSYDEALLRRAFDIAKRTPVKKRSPLILAFHAGLRGSLLGRRGVHSRCRGASSSEYFPRLPALGRFP